MVCVTDTICMCFTELHVFSGVEVSYQPFHRHPSWTNHRLPCSRSAGKHTNNVLTSGSSWSHEFAVLTNRKSDFFCELCFVLYITTLFNFFVCKNKFFFYSQYSHHESFQIMLKSDRTKDDNFNDNDKNTFLKININVKE